MARVLAGSAAGGVAAFATAPLDLVKTRLQVQRIPPNGHGPVQYRGILGTLRTTVMREGALGPFKGLGSTLLGLIPNWAVYFTAYGYLQDVAAETALLGRSHAATNVAASVGAGALTAVATNPIWCLKVRLQTQPHGPHAHYEGIAHALTSMVRKEGAASLFKGLTASLMGVSHVAVQFPLYEHAKEYLYARRTGLVLERGDAPLHVSELVLASSVSKAAASAATYPLEVVRSRLQRQRGSRGRHYRSVLHAFRSIVRHEGVASLYAGFGTNLVRTVPSCAITFTVYELMLPWFRRHVHEARH